MMIDQHNGFFSFSDTVNLTMIDISETGDISTCVCADIFFVEILDLIFCYSDRCRLLVNITGYLTQLIIDQRRREKKNKGDYIIRFY